jgi:CTD small phosphatase-like protein 2
LEREQKNKYFDYRFYRQHATIVNNDFIKDLSKIGRDINRMIIVDNMPQNFRLQKENGIFIKTFYGEDQEDCALFELKSILIKMAGFKANDIRKSLALFKDDIMKKISSNLSRKK